MEDRHYIFHLRFHPLSANNRKFQVFLSHSQDHCLVVVTFATLSRHFSHLLLSLDSRVTQQQVQPSGRLATDSNVLPLPRPILQCWWRTPLLLVLGGSWLRARSCMFRFGWRQATPAHHIGDYMGSATATKKFMLLSSCRACRLFRFHLHSD